MDEVKELILSYVRPALVRTHTMIVDRVPRATVDRYTRISRANHKPGRS